MTSTINIDSVDDGYDDDGHNDYDDDICNDVAIIGMAGRFPMAGDIDEFWENLVSSQNCIRHFSREEALKMGVDAEMLDNPDYISATGYIPDQDKFDAHFFGYSPSDAAKLDPQHRFSLEVAWQAMENAGYYPEQVKHSVGVFAGICSSTYLFNLLQQESAIILDAVDMQVSVDRDMAATLISYKLNLHGPSISVGTACSTSLVAIHLACQSILNGECKMALAGGSNITTPNTVGQVYREGAYISPDGFCRAFDEEAKGTVPGNGSCFVLLKALDEAIADNDHIYAVVKGSAINNDGSEKISYTAPSIEGQTNIVAEAQAIAGVSPESIRFIEAHGTGTPLGDPIELAALTRAFRIETDKKQFCGIGSLKTNIGHLGIAAGGAGIIKTALALKHKIIPESLNYKTPNPKLQIESSPFYVVDKLERIEESEEPARAGVSSLGIGGTNAHIILEEPPVIDSSSSRDFQLLLLSAKTPTALNHMSDNLSKYLESSDEKLGDAAFTLQQGRKTYDFKRAFVLANEATAKASLVSAELGFTAKSSDRKKKIIFMFPGGGTQHIDMAKDLYRSEPVFKDTMDQCAELFKIKCGLDPIALLYAGDTSKNDTGDSKTPFLQRPRQFFTVIFSVEYSLAKLFMHWGIQPDGMIGHSLGEYVAACISGVFSLDDVTSLIAFRGDLFEKIGKGAMLSVNHPASEIEAKLIPGVTIATINDPERCVVAGKVEAIEKFEQLLQEQQIEFRRLAIDTAGHSEMLDPLLPEFGDFLQTLKFNPATVPFISNISGQWADSAELQTPDYWKKHLRQTVMFSDGVKTLLSEGESIFLEVGPGNALSSFVRAQVEPKSGHVLINAMRHIKEEKDDQAHLLETLGKLWINGVDIDWQAFYEGETRKRIPLPTYPYDRKRYWMEPKKNIFQIKEKLSVDDWFWQASWRLAEAVKHNIKDNSAAVHKVLIFADKAGLSDQVATTLAAQDIKPIIVTRGETYRRLSEDRFELNPLVSDDYKTLLEELNRQNNFPNKILNCWNLDPLSGQNSGKSSAEQEPSSIIYHLPFVYLAKALGESPCQTHNKTLIDIVAVTQQFESVTPGDIVDPDKSLIVGPAKVIPYEYPNISFRVIDLGLDNLPEFKVIPEISVAQVASELLCSALPNETTVALRHNLRFVKDFNPLPLQSNKAMPDQLKEGGVYLVTGGIGGVGMVHAAALAAYKPRLVLMQRRLFPDASQWDSILEKNENLIVVDQINGIKNLQDQGAEVLLLQADVCDSEQLVSALQDIRARWGGIDGLIHCAGYGEFVSVADTNEKIIDDVLAPKVMGTNNLLAALADDNLDFVLLCSSMSAQTSGFGLVGYVSACAYLDAIAFSQQESATRYASINWDLWKTSQQLVKNKIDQAAGVKSADLKNAILAREGEDVIRRVLDTSHTQVIISTREFRSLLKNNEQFSRASLLEDIDAVSGVGDVAEFDLYERPSLSTPYVEAANDKEKILAKIWQEALGFSKIGVNDNFFELGGESLLGVKIVVKAKQKGLFIDPKKMFTSPTIKQIIEQLDDGVAIEAEQGLVSGSVPCTGIQAAFFDMGYQSQNHWNVSTLLKLETALAEEPLTEIANRLAEHHDVLRSSFVQSAGKWQQCFDAKGASYSQYFDYSDVQLQEFSQKVESQSAALQASLDIASGKVFQLVYFKGPEQQGRLLLIVHHLVMDAVSLGSVLEDLVLLIDGGQSKTEGLSLPAKTTSFKEYSLKLSELADSQSLDDEQPYWSKCFDAELACSFKPEFSSGKNRESHVQEHSFSLSAEATQALNAQGELAESCKLNQLLVLAVGALLAEKSQQSRVLVDIVGHGRDAVVEGLDLTRTAGWFGCGVPAVLSYASGALAAQLPSLKQQLDEIPNNGLGFSLLKHLSKKDETRRVFADYPQASVAINYLGKQQASSSQVGVISAAEENLDNIRDSENIRQYEHELIAYVQEGELRVTWKYSAEQFSEAKIVGLAEELISKLSAIANSKLYLDISDDVLSNIGLSADKISAAYDLTPLQSEMYRLWSDKNRAQSNVTQGVSVIDGDMDVNLLKGLWQVLIARHPSLRSCFVSDGPNESLAAPRQLVIDPETYPACLDIEINEEDWSDKSDAEQKILTQALLEKDRLTPYDLHRAPALRLYVVKLKKDASKTMILQSNHQIILDGWSSSLLGEDLSYCGLQLFQGENPQPRENMAEHQQYMQWLNKQDLAEIRSYWASRFTEYNATDIFQSIANKDSLNDGSKDRYAEHNFSVDENLITKINLATRASQTTPNAIFQGAWALTLRQLSAADDLVYGVTVSGRSSDLDGIDNIIGQCTNSLPMRVSMKDTNTSIAQWLQTLHKDNTDLQHNNLISRSEIEKIIGVEGSPLYQSNFIFENVPMSDNGDTGNDVSLSVSESYWTDGWQFPLRVFVVPEGDSFWLRFSFDKTLFSATVMVELAAKYVINLQALSEDVKRQLGDVLLDD